MRAQPARHCACRPTIVSLQVRVQWGSNSSSIKMVYMFLWSLIVLQFLLAAILVLSARWWPFPWTPMLIGMPGIGLALSAWIKMGLRRIRIHPGATAQTRLITSGPYRVVRHPMYTGLLWFTAAMLLSGFTWWRLIMWIALVLVLRVKAAHEERSMTKLFPEYTAYQKRVGQILPKR